MLGSPDPEVTKRSGQHPPKNMRWIYISPHFDDAVLSCGGLIHEQTRQGMAVEIWTICAGDAPDGPLSPLARRCHTQWGIESGDDVVAARRIENEKAAAEVGAETFDFGIPDCIYRRSRTGDLLYPEDVFVAIDPVEKELDEEIAAALTSELLPDDIIVCPLSIGGHVDHVLTRSSVERLASSKIEGSSRPLRYYADVPYLLEYPEMLAPAARGLIETVFPVPEEALAPWQDGIAAYASQITMVFGTDEKMRASIRSYWGRRHGVGLWAKGS